MIDSDLAATCIADEAANQPYEGKVAVGIVLLNRMTKKYESDGTVPGTVLKHFQFSGFWFAMQAGHYTQIENDVAGALAKANELFEEFSAQPIWADCKKAWADAQAWKNGTNLSFSPGPEFHKLTRDTVLYLNPKISKASWATPEKLDATIFQHTFYHA